MTHGGIPRYLPQEEPARFFAVIQPPRDRALFDVMYKYGLRVGEASLLDRDDLDLTRSKLTVRRLKGGTPGEKPLFRDTRRLLTRYLAQRPEAHPALFIGRQGRLTPRQIRQLFDRYRREAGLKANYTVHSLRHSIATHLLDAGQPLEMVSAMRRTTTTWGA